LNNNLTSITIPDGVDIRVDAFRGNQLTTVTLGSGVHIDTPASMGIHGPSLYALHNANQQAAGTYTFVGGGVTPWVFTPAP